MGTIAYVVFFVGLVKLLYPWILALLLVLLVVMVIFTTPSFFSNIKSEVNLWRRQYSNLITQKDSLILLGCVVLILGTSSLLPLYPPYDWDSVMYHLTVAKIYVQSHAVVVTEFLRYPLFTQLNHMLFTLMLLYSDDLSAQLVPYLFYILVAALLYTFGQRHFSHLAGILAAILWLSNPIAMRASSVAYIDIGVVLFGTSGVLAFLNYYKTRQMNWLILAGILLGFGAAIKYPAIVWIGLCGFYTLWIGFRERKLHIPILFGFISMLVACPFYLRNVYYTGDPFFPYISIFFKENIWTKADFANVALNQSGYGLPVTFINFVKLPWFLHANPKLFLSSFPAYSSTYLAFLPITLLVGFLKPSLRNILIISLGFTVFWFLTPQTLRFLFPVFALFCLLTAAAFDYLQSSILVYLRKRFTWRFHGWLSPLIYIVIIVPIALSTSVTNIKTTLELGLPPATAANRDAFLTARLPSYPVYQYLNAKYDKNYRIYALFDENMAYFADGVFMGDWFGPARYSDIIPALSDSRQLYTNLKRLDAQYFLYQGNREQPYTLPDDIFFREKFKKIYDNHGVLLFELAPLEK